MRFAGMASDPSPCRGVVLRHNVSEMGRTVAILTTSPYDICRMPVRARHPREHRVTRHVLWRHPITDTIPWGKGVYARSPPRLLRCFCGRLRKYLSMAPLKSWTLFGLLPMAGEARWTSKCSCKEIKSHILSSVFCRGSQA